MPAILRRQQERTGQKRNEQHSFMKTEPRKSREDGPGYATIEEAGVERGETHQVQSSEDLLPLPEHHTEGDMNRNPRSRC